MGAKVAPAPSASTRRRRARGPETGRRFTWSIANLLRGRYKPKEYGEVVLPMTILRRLDCILAPTKDAVHPNGSPPATGRARTSSRSSCASAPATPSTTPRSTPCPRSPATAPTYSPTSTTSATTSATSSPPSDSRSRSNGWTMPSVRCRSWRGVARDLFAIIHRHTSDSGSRSGHRARHFAVACVVLAYLRRS